MEAIGLILDGGDLCLARLRKQRGVVEIVALERVRLSGPEEESQATTQDEHYREVMGLAEGSASGGDEGASATHGSGAQLVVSHEDDAEMEANPVSREERTLHNALFRHADKGLQLGIALEQEDVSFTNIGLPEPLPPRKLRRRIREELTRIDPAVGEEAFDYVPRQGDSVLAFSHNGEMGLLDRVRRANEALADPLRLALVDVNEVALMNLFTRLVTSTAGMSVLVYVGNEFSRLLFFRDGGFHDLSPVIHEGVSAVGNLSQCYGRILAELDVAGVDALDGIYVTGGADTEEYRSFFEERFPGCQVRGLPYTGTMTGDEDLLQQAGAYALPISLAWKVLEARPTDLAQTNFLPHDLRRGWMSTALAWHGWMLVSLCATSLVVAVTAAAIIHSRVTATRADLELVEAQIVAVTPAAMVVDELARRIEAVQEQSALVDSLRCWDLPASDLVRDLTMAAKESNSMWLTDLTLSDGVFATQGVSLYGNRIHRFAERQVGTQIHSVALTTILGKTLYEYDISGPVPVPVPVVDGASVAATAADREATP
ncbi:MAG: hypothetical protein HN404_12325 [Gemmatimonadetes bacterium]|nr:hypothetical protein [Gemmatimonadota bacterium]